MKTLSAVEICEIADAHRFRLLAIDGNQHLRIVCGERCQQPGNILASPAHVHNLVSHSVQIAQRVSALVLQHELESAEAAHALHSRRFNHCHESALGHEHQHLQLLSDAANYVAGRMAACRDVAVPVLTNMMPEFGAFPEKLNPITEKSPCTSRSCPMMASPRSASARRVGE